MFRVWTYVTYVFNLLVCFGIAGALVYVVVLKPTADPGDRYGVIFGLLVLFASVTNAYLNFLFLFRNQHFYPRDSLAEWSRADRQANAPRVASGRRG